MSGEELSNNTSILVDDIGEWSLKKYALIRHYTEIFSTAMSRSWPKRVYIDLFCGTGKAQVRGSNKDAEPSPILALRVKKKFSHYIFCEIDEKRLTSLKTRVKQEYPDIHTEFIQGDVNKIIQTIIDTIPKKSISFCVVDPYRIKNLQFATIEKLSKDHIHMDFFILIPSYMDVHRNLISYTEPTNQNIELFLGDQNWRQKWNRVENNLRFGYFILIQFKNNMEKLGFLEMKPEHFVTIKNKKNVSLYHLAFFTRNPLGIHFWEETIRISSQQRDLFL